MLSPTGVDWQIEDENAEERDEQRGQNEVDGIEQRLASDDDVKGDVGLRGSA